MIQDFPVTFQLKDGTRVVVKQFSEDSYEFHLTRLNSEKHNFFWHQKTGTIEESYETRFDQWQLEAIDIFKEMLAS
jgi:hypothetical protein